MLEIITTVYKQFPEALQSRFEVWMPRVTAANVPTCGG
jgi:hypothetical protein